MINITLPIKTVSEANSSEHWVKKHKRHKLQQFLVRCALKSYLPIALPCVVKLTRLSPKTLDAHDNLRTAFKFIVDEISECLIPDANKFYLDKKGNVRQLKGRADSDERITWEYAQEKQKQQGIRIEIR